MKKYKLLFLVVFAIFTSACNEWLTVNPEEEISEDLLFENGEGFRNALNGVYRTIGSSNLYGRELSYGLIAYLAQEFDGTKTYIHAYRTAVGYEYKYDRLQTVVDAIWVNAYNAIANCNNIIANIQQTDSMKFYKRSLEKALIHGEALGLRAMLHFDLLRMFAASPVDNSGAKWIPYVDVYPVMFPPKLTMKETFERIVKDLKEARELVANYDTLYMPSSVGYRLEYMGGNSNDDRFFGHRGYRLNYYAITALLARVYLYAGNLDEAYNEAYRLLKTDKGSTRFKFTSSSYDMKNGKIKLYDDVIYAGYNAKLGDIERQVNESGSGNYSTRLALQPDGANVIFKNEVGDYRYRYQIEVPVDEHGEPLKNGDRVLIKYREQSSDKSKGKYNTKMIPMLRLSEMYYILAETMYKKAASDAEKQKAWSYLEYIRNVRGLSSTPPTPTESSFMDLLYNEMQREFLGDGQMFFQFKRLKRPIPLKDGAELNLGTNFIVPIPDSENI
ncbi:RagB/SusD family nutrient uptake outer membrane protein [Gabonibacter massiliensis]|uniref:RagB/SusD family nutrient uptake outer membrane protein n=1 Tax=Gabonibacter massiliensis TaxID=1720195 RepID=UPI00073F6A37|nr:RagB/SusD family nutrient uptake outer membrane protein [Gabonibacter massiliensis]